MSYMNLVMAWFITSPPSSVGEHLTGVRKVIGSNPVGGSDFFSLSHAREMMNIASFSFYYRAEN